MLTFISNHSHYTDVLLRSLSVKRTLWIGTADIKDLYVESGKDKKPFLGEWRCASSTPKNPARPSGRISINIPCYTTGWSGFFVRGCTLRC